METHTITGLEEDADYQVRVRARYLAPVHDPAWSGKFAKTTARTSFGISVSDAEVEEASGVTLDFVVTLARAVDGPVTVDYATSDGTATAGDDYTATSGTLTFAAGETTKTVAVPVLDDAVEDNGETVNFTLSNASGAQLSDSHGGGHDPQRRNIAGAGARSGSVGA